MRYRITGLALPESTVEDPRQLAEVLAQALGIPTTDLIRPEVVKHSLDARRRPARHIWSVEVEVLEGVQVHPRPPRGVNIKPLDPEASPAPRYAPGVLVDADQLSSRLPSFTPVVVGAGPAGLFAALALARLGAPPLVIERGDALESRGPKVEGLWAGEAPDPESNALFGEGGSCAFSDGKIYTRTRDHLVSSVLRELVECGASSQILIEARPHIGSEVLQRVIANLRTRLEELGVELRFGARVDGLLRDGSRILGVRLADGLEIRRAPVILATGHSAFSTFQLLAEAGVPLQSWPTSMGLRIEHPQTFVDQAQYKTMNPRAAGFPPAEYHLAHHCSDGRGVYSFCMCPGGRTVCVSQLPERLVLNGTALSCRGGEVATAGVVVQVRPEDYQPYGDPDRNPLVGFEFLAHWERLAYQLGGGDYVAPAQRVPDFIAGRVSDAPVKTSYVRGTRPADLRDCLPQAVADGIAQALVAFGRRVRGFDGDDAVLLGVETRTSSPVRMLRDAEGRAGGLTGLYPSGEGAGYAGGIVSAAMDGIRVAEWALKHAMP